MTNSMFLYGCSGIVLLSISMISAADDSSARHGYISSPPSRAYLCSASGGNLNSGCGAVQYEPQSVEGPKGFPLGGPEDGKIASAGNSNFAELDRQTTTRWHHVPLSTGDNSFTWTLTAPHKTEQWRFYITKKDWNPNAKLARSQFDLTKPICEKYDGGKVPSNRVTIKGCNIPSEYSGYNVILGIWDIADTQNAFYQVIDVNIKS